MRFLTKIVLALALPALIPPEAVTALVAEGQATQSSSWTLCANPSVVAGDSLQSSNLGDIPLLDIDALE